MIPRAPWLQSDTGELLAENAGSRTIIGVAMIGGAGMAAYNADKREPGSQMMTWLGALLAVGALAALVINPERKTP